MQSQSFWEAEYAQIAEVDRGWRARRGF